MNELGRVWNTVKDRPTGEFLNYLNDRCKHGKETTLEDFQNTRAYAETAIAAFHFANHLTGEE